MSWETTIVLGWLPAKWFDAIQWQAKQCPCPVCVGAIFDLPKLLSLALLHRVGPATQQEIAAIDTLLKLKEAYEYHEPNSISPQAS